MVRIDTLSLRRALFVLAPVVGLLGIACGGSADGRGGGDSTDDPANVATVQGYEGQDPGWAAALEEAKVPAPAAADANDGSSDLGKSQDALTNGSRGLQLLNEHKRQLSSLKISTSYYDHTTYMNEATGTRRTDCSGWVDYSLTRVLSSAYDLVPHPNTFKPLADDWYNYLSSRPTSASSDLSKPRWRKIPHAQDLKPGDLVVWLQADSSASDNTGHVMMVNGAPTTGRDGEYLIPVMDSTTAPHANDSRGTTHTGPGTGTIGLKVNSAGTPVAYYWRGGLSYNSITTSIVLGRLE